MPIRKKDYQRWPTSRKTLFLRGIERVNEFCEANRIQPPPIQQIGKEKWFVSACAYYRPETEATKKYTSPGINICLELCGRPCSEPTTRNWSWPGSTVDRGPYGVLCHELGHHCDWHTGAKKWSYGSEYCEEVKQESGEPGITSYAQENPAEWFAESFRLFVTNPGLLQTLRPLTYSILTRRWKPLLPLDWRVVLGSNVPERVVKSLLNKGAKQCT